MAEALSAIDRGLSPLVFTARGPDDPAVQVLREALRQSGLASEIANARIGTALGRILDAVIRRAGLGRAVISGGDTSGHASRQLGIHALTALAPTIPGAAIFEAYADGPHDRLQLALKGGQMGSADYFGWVWDGAAMQLVASRQALAPSDTKSAAPGNGIKGQAPGDGPADLFRRPSPRTLRQATIGAATQARASRTLPWT